MEREYLESFLLAIEESLVTYLALVLNELLNFSVCTGFEAFLLQVIVYLPVDLQITGLAIKFVYVNRSNVCSIPLPSPPPPPNMALS